MEGRKAEASSDGWVHRNHGKEETSVVVRGLTFNLAKRDRAVSYSFVS